MVRYFLLLCCLIFSFLRLTCQTAGLEGEQIVLGQLDGLYSDLLKEERPIWVYVPQSAGSSDEKFPVVYLLDGNAHFYSVAGMFRQLAEVNGNTIAPETIIVAIPNTDRMRDLTPTAARYFPNSGGADRFAQFIENELIPYIDQKYPTSSYRTLVGHSWGALFVLHTLTHHPSLFENYVSIDPGIRWDDQKFLKQTKAALQSHDFEGKSLYLGVANRLPKGHDLHTVKADTSKSSEHMRKMLELVDEAGQAKGLDFQWKFYPDDHHLSVPLIATYDAIRYLFQWYSFNEEIIFDETTPMNASEFIDLLTAHFANISTHFGYETQPSERLVNRLAEASLSFNDQDKAHALYDMNIRNYPNSPYVYEAMGDYYVSQRNVEKSIAFYEKSLNTRETTRARAKLKRIKGEAR